MGTAKKSDLARAVDLLAREQHQEAEQAAQHVHGAVEEVELEKVDRAGSGGKARMTMPATPVATLPAPTGRAYGRAAAPGPPVPRRC